MKTLIAAALLLCAGLARADSTDSPATAPSTQPVAAAAPTTEPADNTTLPSPAELIRKMKSMQTAKALLAKVAYFDLSRPVQEKSADFSFFGDDGSNTLRSLLTRIRQARDDGDVKAVLITLGEHGLNLAQAQEIRQALGEVRAAGKRTFVYADSYDTIGYTLASGASDICLLEGGEIMIPGVGMETTFLKGLFDKIGVKADYVQIGEYKGADEEYTRTTASDELKGELTHLTDALYGQIVDGISLHRKLQRETVSQLVDDTIVTASAAKERGFVDHLCDEDALRALMAKELGKGVDIDHEYGKTAREAPDLSSPLSILQLFSKKPAAQTENPSAIALVYAEGVISDGEGGDGLMSESGVGGETLRKAFRIAERDDNIKAMVIRIDSPGGSALASEVMWQAARHVAAKKPVIISIGSMAASGGYYLASSGDHIFADPSAIVGSIGVVGGKFVFQDLYEKLGLKTETFKKGNNAGLFSTSEPFTDRQRTMVTTWMKQTYVQFTERVMKTRTGKIKDIDKVARGRIFVAGQAKDLGMIDEIGGIDDAIAYAAKNVGLEKGKFDVRVLPVPRTLADFFGLGGSPEAAYRFKPTVQISADSMLGALAPSLRNSLAQQLDMLRLLQKHPVLLVAPYSITVK